MHAKLHTTHITFDFWLLSCFIFTSDEKTEQVMESMTKKRRKISQATSIDASKMPSTEEIEDFFSVAEMLQKKRFMEK